MSSFFRRTVFAFVLGAALTAAVLVGRSAFATTDTINACFKPSNGTLYLLGSGRSECQPGDIPISWNTAGVNGQDGVSVTSQVLTAGADAACPNGGSKFTAANGTSYACNGSNGQDGQDGQPGQDGQNGQDGQPGQNGVSVTTQSLAPGEDQACPNGGTKFIATNGTSYACNGADGQNGQNFNGTFASPNGQYKLVVNDTTARLEGPLGRVQINGSGMEVNANGPLNVSAQNALTLHAAGLFSASGAVTTIGGSAIFLNGSSCGLFRPGDFAAAVGPGGGPILLNPSGSPTVRFAC